MDWQLVSSISGGLGMLLSIIGLLLRFRVGRWLLGALWLILILVSLFTGDLTDSEDFNTNPIKASWWLFYIGGSCLLLSLVIYVFTNQ